MWTWQPDSTDLQLVHRGAIHLGTMLSFSNYKHMHSVFVTLLDGVMRYTIHPPLRVCVCGIKQVICSTYM